MHRGTYVFSQIMECIPRHDFDNCIKKYKGERYTKSFSCRDQFLSMAFGQLSYRESLRDTVACLSSHRNKSYHLGFTSSVTLATLARANEKRNWHMYRDLAQVLITTARKLYGDEPSIAEDIHSACYAIDSSSIELCLSLFKWSPYVKTKSAIKLHIVLDIQGSIPTFFDMTSGKVADVTFLDSMTYETEAFYVLDRGYIDYTRLYRIHTSGAFFVTRAKVNSRLTRRYSRLVDKTTGVISDQIVCLSKRATTNQYKDTMRRITYRDKENHYYVFITNNLTVSAYSIALLYKNRWQVELFFKWIKQHLKIKTFWGYTENAVKTQICIALCVYLIVAILKKRLKLKQNLYEILQILSISLFDKSLISELFSDIRLQKEEESAQKPLSLFDF